MKLKMKIMCDTWKRRIRCRPRVLGCRDLSIPVSWDVAGFRRFREDFTEETLPRGIGGDTREFAPGTEWQEECGCGTNQHDRLGDCQRVVLEGDALQRV